MKLEVGTTVVHKEDPYIRGVILNCINEGDPDDVQTQGLRYYVATGGKTYSVPGNRLVVTGAVDSETLEKIKIEASKYANLDTPCFKESPKIDYFLRLATLSRGIRKKIEIEPSSIRDVLLITKSHRLSNLVNDVVAHYPCRLGKGEVAFHLEDWEFNSVLYHLQGLSETQSKHFAGEDE